MLVVSDLLSVARGLVPARQLGDRAPQRFGDRAKRSPVVVWNVCRHCNMTCPHCYASASARPSAGDLSTSEAERMLDGMAEVGVRILIFSGGEPLLRPDLLELVAYARGLGLACHLSTNGVLIDADMAARLHGAGITYVGVSIDGTREHNDAYRGLAGGFDRALEGLSHARSAGMRTGLRMTVTRRNRGEIGALLDLCRERDFDRFYLSHLVYAGRGRRIAGEDLSPEQCRAALTWLFERADAMLAAGDATPKIVTGGNDSDGVLLWHWVRERHGEHAATQVRRLLVQRGGNSAGEGIVNVDNRGVVHPDQFWQGVRLGDLRTQSFAEVLRHPFREELRGRASRLGGRCGACIHVALCRGSHRERAVAAGGKTWDPDPACVMTDAEVLWPGRATA